MVNTICINSFRCTHGVTSARIRLKKMFIYTYMYREGCWFDHSVSWLSVCLSAYGAKNVSWPLLSPLRRWGSLTISLNGKFVYIYKYMYKLFKKVKNLFLKCFDVCLHQSILFTTHLKIFTIFYSDIYNKIVITIML